MKMHIKDQENHHFGAFFLKFGLCSIVLKIKQSFLKRRCTLKIEKIPIFGAYSKLRSIFHCVERTFWKKMQMCRCQFRKGDRWASHLSLAKQPNGDSWRQTPMRCPLGLPRYVPFTYRVLHNFVRNHLIKFVADTEMRR